MSSEPIINIFLGSDKCQARCESGLTFVEYGLTLWRCTIIAQITTNCYVTAQVEHMHIKFLSKSSEKDKYTLTYMMICYKEYFDYRNRKKTWKRLLANSVPVYKLMIPKCNNSTSMFVVRGLLVSADPVIPIIKD